MKLSSLLALVLLLAASTVARADILLSHNVDYNQTFTTTGVLLTNMPSTTNNTAYLSTLLPDGWFMSEAGGTGSNGSFSTNTGSGTAGDTYSYGASGSTDRAFGTLQSASNPTIIIGAKFINNHVLPLTKLNKLRYTGEQWRLGSTGRLDQLIMEISTNATSLTSGTWTAITGMTFVAPVTAGTVGALDGNLAANQTVKSLGYVVGSNYTLPTAVAVGGQFWIRWTDTAAAGSDDGLAIDSFTINAIPEPSSMALCGALVAGMFGFGLIRRRKQSAR